VHAGWANTGFRQCVHGAGWVCRAAARASCASKGICACTRAGCMCVTLLGRACARVPLPTAEAAHVPHTQRILEARDVPGCVHHATGHARVCTPYYWTCQGVCTMPLDMLGCVHRTTGRAKVYISYYWTRQGVCTILLDAPECAHHTGRASRRLLAHSLRSWLIP